MEIRQRAKSVEEEHIEGEYDTGVETPPQQVVEVQAGGKAYV